MPLFTKSAQYLFAMSATSECDVNIDTIGLDGNGRFLISKRLMKVAEIEQDLQFIGMDNTIEIWAPEKLKETLKSEEEFGIEFENIMNVSDNL